MNTTQVADPREPELGVAKRGSEDIVYLFGAGASHACANWVASPHGILMRDLAEPFIEKIQELESYRSEPEIRTLVNTVVTAGSDIEQIITFLAQSPSSKHQSFAEELRKVFEYVLKHTLEAIQADHGAPPIDLYTALLDMHDVPQNWERLNGIITLNYDEYLELAIRAVGRDVDFGIVVGPETQDGPKHRLLKLHGSLGWKHAWPVSAKGTDDPPFWIPPGIQKSKSDYPFNLLWGAARELLDCDVLRIIGCNLGPNDWDLVSLLFSTRHTHDRRPTPYRVEVVDSPAAVRRVKKGLPYLDVRSIFESGLAGARLLFELTDLLGPYDALTPEQQQLADNRIAGRNYFQVWLQHMAEGLFEELGTVATPNGFLKTFMEAN